MMENETVTGNNESPASLRRLEIWNDGLLLAGMVYQLSRNWPKEEIHGLTSQSRRAAVSISANMAEGVGRGSPREIIRFSRIALGSGYELHTLLHLAINLGCSPSDAVQPIIHALDSLLKRLNRFIQYQENKL